MRYDIIFANEIINTVTAKQSPRQLFKKKLPFSRREGNRQSSFLVSTMTDVTAVLFQKSIVMISLILQAIRLLMLSNLCSRSQQLKLKFFFYGEGKPMVNHFVNNQVGEVLVHILGCPKPSSNYPSAKGSITSLNPST